ncbi:MAG: hypothetical protein ACXW4B_11270 [Micavibrio sp.]
MPILPPGVSAKGKYALGQADIAVPDHLITPRDQEDWTFYATCLPPVRLIAKFTEALDQFHGVYHASTSHPDPLTSAEKDFLHSKWNATSILAVQIIERLQFEEAKHPTAFKDAISESLFYLNHFLSGINAPTVQEWRDRADYYNKIDAMVMQEIANESFERQAREQSVSRKGWAAPRLH